MLRLWQAVNLNNQVKWTKKEKKSQLWCNICDTNYWNTSHRAKQTKAWCWNLDNFFLHLGAKWGEDTDAQPGRFTVEWECSLGHLGFHCLCSPLRSSLSDFLQKIVDLEAKGLDLFVPCWKGLTGWEEDEIRISVFDSSRFGLCERTVTILFNRKWVRVMFPVRNGWPLVARKLNDLKKNKKKTLNGKYQSWHLGSVNGVKRQIWKNLWKLEIIGTHFQSVRSHLSDQWSHSCVLL